MAVRKVAQTEVDSGPSCFESLWQRAISPPRLSIRALDTVRRHQLTRHAIDPHRSHHFRRGFRRLGIRVLCRIEGY
jgi:hypothetical protein